MSAPVPPPRLAVLAPRDARPGAVVRHRLDTPDGPRYVEIDPRDPRAVAALRRAQAQVAALTDGRRRMVATRPPQR